ncbi:hypothetical protein GCM10023322_07520 [Rugosimonospora acidiphila]|uniref:Uncharacterized protein n=1 Tax=Rugosimonospora acidiphila TaxID=556531 RepID=A0ABP9RJJ7_9ACTN
MHRELHAGLAGPLPDVTGPHVQAAEHDGHWVGVTQRLRGRRALDPAVKGDDERQ